MRRNRVPGARAEADRRDLLLGADRLHQRDQLAGDEREGDEGRRQDQPRGGEDDLDVVLAQPGPEHALGAEEEHEDQAGDHRRDGERQIDHRRQQRAARKAEARDRPGGREAEDEVERPRPPAPPSRSARWRSRVSGSCRQASTSRRAARRENASRRRSPGERRRASPMTAKARAISATRTAAGSSCARRIFTPAAASAGRSLRLQRSRKLITPSIERHRQQHDGDGGGLGVP
jgi:hypothetical protein